MTISIRNRNLASCSPSGPLHMDHLIVDQKNSLVSRTQKTRIQKEALFGTASQYHFLRMLLSISVIYASVLCETHCSAHSLGLSFHPPPRPNNERAEFIVRSSAASVIKPDCNQKGGSFLFRAAPGRLVSRGAHSRLRARNGTDGGRLITHRCGVIRTGERDPTPRRAATIRFVGFGRERRGERCYLWPCGTQAR